MRTLVIGMGEVGTALAEVLRQGHEVDTLDFSGTTGGWKYPAWERSAYPTAEPAYDILNVCFGWCKGFEEEVRGYAEQARAPVVIHSTLPVGTTRTLGDLAVSSPIHGVHPHLADSLRTFVKYVGGTGQQQVQLAYQLLAEVGIRAQVVSSPEVAEASKLWMTTGYAWNILLCKEIKRYCDANGVSFDEVYGYVRAYNEGYAKLGRPEVAWPILTPTPGPLGRHCLRPNADLLDSRVAEIVRAWSDSYKDEVQ